VPWQTYGVQSLLTTAGQLAALPEQLAAIVPVPEEHDAARQEMLLALKPSAGQLTPFVPQTSCTSQLVPAAIGRQTEVVS